MALSRIDHAYTAQGLQFADQFAGQTNVSLCDTLSDRATFWLTIRVSDVSSLAQR
jgi:hypothetical protein